MIVDDTADSAISFRAALEQYGFQVDTFTDPEQALAHFSPERYSVVISDIRMPNLSGFELARKIDALDKDAKIILMSAFHMTREEFEKVLPSTRVDVFIKKPVGMTKLMDHLSVLLGNYKEGRWSLRSSFIASVGIIVMQTLLTQDNTFALA
jgi:DNA-binding response OmpR family regulator